MALVGKGDYDAALASLRTVEAKYPRDRVVLNQMARTLSYGEDELRHLGAAARVGTTAADALFPYNSPIQEPGNIGRHLIDMAIGQKSWFLMSLFLVSVGAYFLFRIDARLALVDATRGVLANGLDLSGDPVDVEISMTHSKATAGAVAMVR